MAQQSNGGAETWHYERPREADADYEDRAARISILAGGIAPRPDTLKQTEKAAC